MVQISPSVDRIASILNFMAAHPEHRFTVSELVKSLRISKTTCHTLIASLVRVGYVYRTHDGLYLLGPALASIGHIAAKHASPLLIAQPEMRALSDEFDSVCSAYFRERDHLVVRERVVSRSDVGWLSPLGTSLQLRPPFGAMFYAWSSAAEIKQWLDNTSSALTPAERSNFEGGMAFARENLFAFTIRNESDNSSQRNDEALAAQLIAGTELDSLRDYNLISVFAPVFDASRKVMFSLSLGGLMTPVCGEKIAAMGQKLREACFRITTFIGGKLP